MHAIQREVVDRLQVTDWRDVEQHLRSLTGRRAGDPGDGIAVAVGFYREVLGSELAGRYPSALLELLGVDYSRPVQRLPLSPGRYQTYCVCDRVLGTQRPHEGRVLRDASGGLLAPRIGAFLTDVGVGADRLGLFAGNRVCVRLQLLRQAPALRTSTSGIVDHWSDKPTWSTGAATPHLAGGGGVQYRIPRIVAGDRDALVVV